MAVVVVLVLGGVVAAVLLTSGGSGSGRTGQPTAAPAIALPNLDESKGDIKLSDFKGKPMLVNFWATWCTPCVEEMPMLEDAYRRSGAGQKVVFLGVNRQDFRPDAQNFVRRTGVTYPSAYDRDGALDEAYRLRGMPTSVFIDKDGRIVRQVTGPLTKAQLDEQLKELTEAAA